jgi:peptidyl-prolyl cis-trans isomerase B (cyclophilin B)
MRKQIQRWLVLTCCVALVSLSGVALAGCDSQSGNSSAATNSNTETTETTTITAQASNQDMTQLPKLEGKATVVMTVNGSPITIEVDGDNAPITAGNFVDLVQQGVYDGLVFHRVVTSPQPFVAQGGDPQGKDPSVPASRLGTGSFTDPDTNQPRYIPLEIKPQGADEPIYGKTLKQAGVTAPPLLAHTRGALAMARSQMPNSASAQFYFALADLQFLDGDYAVFGYVTEGMEAVDAIAQGDRIDSAEVTAGLENLKK